MRLGDCAFNAVPEGGTVPIGFVIRKPQGPSTGEVLIKVYGKFCTDDSLAHSCRCG